MTFSEKRLMEDRSKQPSPTGNTFTLFLGLAGENRGLYPYHLCAAHLYEPGSRAGAPAWCSPETDVIDGTGTEALYDGILGALAEIRERGLRVALLCIVVNNPGHQLLPVFGKHSLEERRGVGYRKWKHKPTLARIDNEAEALGIVLSCRVAGYLTPEEYERLDNVADDAANRKQAYRDDIEAGTERFTSRKSRA